MSGTALVTGGAGFIGSHLVDRLLAAGWQVRTLDDLSTGRRENLESAAPRSALRVVEGSVLDTRLVEDLVDGVDVVFHLAATVGVDLVVREPLRTLRTNLGGTESVLAAAGHRGTPVLLASSSEVYGRTARVPQAEDDDRWLGPPGSARWSYATSKAAAECLALAWHRERGLPTVVARLFNTIGARQRGRYGMVVPRFVSAAVRGSLCASSATVPRPAASVTSATSSRGCSVWPSMLPPTAASSTSGEGRRSRSGTWRSASSGWRVCPTPRRPGGCEWFRTTRPASGGPTTCAGASRTPAGSKRRSVGVRGSVSTRRSGS